MTTNKLLSSMKLFGVIILMVICALPANAQFLRTSYFMEGSHYRMQLNPALTPTKGYFNLPVIGSLNATVSSTTFGYQDIMDIIDDSGDFYTNPKFLGRLKDNNNLNVNLSTEILSAGWYKGENFWSFNIGLRTDIGAKLTKNMFNFLNEMDELGNDWSGQEYNIGGQQLNVNAFAEVGVGFARQINSRLTVGGKVKALLGIGDMELKINKAYMNANLPTDSRLNQLQDQTYLQNNYNTPAKLNELKNEINGYHANLAVNATLESSFKGLNLTGMEEKGYIDEFDFESKDMGIAGYGFGIDLGASYKIMDNLTVSASILDLGFISWSKSATKMASANPDDINFQGSKYTAGITDINSIASAMNELNTDVSNYKGRVGNGDVLDYEMLQLKEQDAKKSRKSTLASTFVVGAEYGLLENKLGLGVLSTTRFIQPKALSELTFSANYRPKSWFNVALSYSVIQSAGKSFGLGVKVGPLFIGTDYMFLGKNSNSVSGFIGVSVPLGAKKTNKQG